MTHSMIRDSFQYRKRLAAFVLGLTLFLPLYAFPFTEEHPLVYEDAWDLWPYSFLDNTGEPVGFNIDVLKLICKELDIPYRIKLKPTQDALNDLKAGRSDLMCGMARASSRFSPTASYTIRMNQSSSRPLTTWPSSVLSYMPAASATT